MTHKVWIFLVRTREEGPELLVFEHLDHDAGIQIPAGTVEPNEDFTIAAGRELQEEAGIHAQQLTPLGELLTLWNGDPICAHLYAAQAPMSLPREWHHHVSGHGEDNGMRFRFFWLRYTEWETLWKGFQAGYPLLEQYITKTTNEQKT